MVVIGVVVVVVGMTLMDNGGDQFFIQIRQKAERLKIIAIAIAVFLPQGQGA